MSEDRSDRGWSGEAASRAGDGAVVPESDLTAAPGLSVPAAPDRSGADDLSVWAVPGVDRPAAPPEPLEVSPVVRAVQEAVDALAGVPVGELSREQAMVDLSGVLAVEAVLRRVRLDRLADADARQLYQLDGARSVATWLGRSGEISPAELTVARRLRQYPQVAQALAVGDLTVPMVGKLQAALGLLRPHLDRQDGLLDGQDAEQAVRAVIVDGIRTVVAQARGGFPEHDSDSDTDPTLVMLLRRMPQIADRPGCQLDRLEEAFVLLAGQVAPAQLGGALDLLVSALLPSRLEDAEQAGHDRRYLSLRPHGDGLTWDLTGQLSPLCGERLHTLLDALMRTDPDNVLDTQIAERLRAQGLDPYDPALAPTLTPRSTGQRRHDALDQLLTSHLAADLAGQHDKNPVQTTVTVPLAALQGQPGALPAVTGHGALLPRSTWTALACGSAFTRHVLSLAGKVIETSHTSRTLKAHERKALHTQTGGHCQAAGCTRSTRQPGTVLHPHHANPWSRCGTTSLADTALFCDSCHSHLHRGHPLRLTDGRLLGPHGWLKR